MSMDNENPNPSPYASEEELRFAELEAQRASSTPEPADPISRIIEIALEEQEDYLRDPLETAEEEAERHERARLSFLEDDERIPRPLSELDKKRQQDQQQD